ncbi:uncharacterized protein MAM_06692 [Metarhizium album ARSEF 1941]|uniref:Cupin-like domain-containing protein n=1 Tax=Metarhizium album (strain ARSEF 1941) TaxID=1081103 RepID=A0A0B2WR13_METAS|nr:uncharacterized protein MAM_06692 [Metarhizium album ARSEF 1941]KHN95415.1 hypothetical protein MAM_06692 [Metarhizium album ARSEF 1941]
MTSQIESALEDMISTFNDLNSSIIEELDSEPSPLEFMRFVSRNSPFVVRGAASSWKATREWNSKYLRSALAGQTVNVAVTPHGFAYFKFRDSNTGRIHSNQALPSNADAPTYSPKDGVTVLSKPHEEPQMFNDFLTYVTQQETDDTFPEDSEVIGRKHFVLLPPVCHPCMNEVLLTPATYVRDQTGLSIRLDEGADLVPFVTWDPDHPAMNSTPFSRYAQPMRVTLNPGDMLYLPAMWYVLHAILASNN